jgi:4-alpha-glucanotransferase
MTEEHRRQHRYFRKRRSGVLLHPTSLPTADGPLGEDAYRFTRFLADAGFTLWQMLPVNSIGGQYASPYQGTSVNAGNPWLINRNRLCREPWLDETFEEHNGMPALSLRGLISLARGRFAERATPTEQQAYLEFKQRHVWWLEDYALYCALKEHHDLAPWWCWPEALRRRDAAALASFTRSRASRLEDYYFEQFIFYRQWGDLKRYANQRGILLFGDLPILIAHDSVDVWANTHHFQLDPEGQPVAVAGVPPDYFSASGQRWGNPLYNWRTIAHQNFQWWVNRLRSQLTLFDIVRLDHFRGFVSLWEIPAGCNSAVEGRWQPVPGRALLNVLKREFGDLPIVAEDLGTISQEVLDLRDEFHLPGMKVLLFAFESDNNNPYLPHNHDLKSVVYTGTHDNNTALGWFSSLDDARQLRVLEYLQYPREAMPWPLINTALSSVCPTAILPMQDLLGLDGSHRMNTPGTTEGNWGWHFEWEWLSPYLIQKLRRLNEIYARI